MSEVPAQAGQLKRLSVLIATNFVDMIGFMIVLPLLPFYALEMHASPAMIGAIIASFSIAQLLSAPLWGRISDRFGRRPALLISLFASAVGYVVFGLADSIWLLFLSRVVQGMGGGTTPVAQAYVADTVVPANRARALGWLSAATSAGVMVGPALGSLASHLGQAAPGFIAAGLCLTNFVCAWRWLPESHAQEHRTAAGALRKPIWHAALQVLRQPRAQVTKLVWIYATGMLAFTCLTSVLSLYLDAVFGVTKENIGYVFVYVAALSLVMRSLLLGPIVDRIGETWAMRLGAGLLILGLATFPLAGSLWTLAAVIPFVPIGTALLFPATTSLMSKASHRAEVGTTMGVAQTFAGVARVVAPLLATRVFEISHALPFVVASVTVALVSLLAFQIAVEPRGAGAQAVEGTGIS